MTSERYSRQSFLGDRAEEIFAGAKVGIVGLGGGGSHIVQQLAHIGFRNYAIFDPQTIDESNLNRLVGATKADVKRRAYKVHIAKRVIAGLHPDAVIEAFTGRWQDNPEPLRLCDVIFGCVDSFADRRELEVCARRYLIPYIDIGMDVSQVGGEPPRMVGQVILSMPGARCMTCLGFLNEERLAQEAAQYGVAGPRPQVVWPNGVLASTAVGVAVDLLTGWTRSGREFVYLSYDGNEGIMKPHVRLQFLGEEKCPHYPVDQVGDPVYQSI